MKRSPWMWIAAAALVLVIGGSMFALGRMSGRTEPKTEGRGASMSIDLPRLSEEERELQRIKVAASEVKLEEASKGPDGWVVRVSSETSELDPEKMAKDAAAFFRDLERARVEIAATSFAIVSNSLKDVWGNTLDNVSLLWVGLDKETFARINWQGFDPSNFPRVTEDLWMHELVQRPPNHQE